MISLESITKKLGFNPITYDYSSPTGWEDDRQSNRFESLTDEEASWLGGYIYGLADGKKQMDLSIEQDLVNGSTREEATNMSDDVLRYILSRIIDNAHEAVGEARQSRDDLFKSGRSLAYYEVLDILKTEFSAHEADLEAFGLNVDLEKEFI